MNGIPEAIAASHAVKAYVGNLMTQSNESLGMTASDHIRVLFQHAERKVFDYAWLNTSHVPASLKMAYAAEQAEPIVNDLDRIRELGVEPILGEYLDDRVVARHNCARIARELIEFAACRGRKGKITPSVD